MFCPKCGAENPEGVKVCQKCSWMLTEPGAVSTAPVQTRKTSALAVISMILGILSICTFFLTAPLAFILGVISLFMIARSGGQLKGMGFAITGIVVPIVVLPLMMGITIPALFRARMIAYRLVCSESISDLGKAIALYAEDNGDMFPALENWCDLLIKNDPNLTPLWFRCKGDMEGQGSYAINQNVAKLGSNAPSDMVLLFEAKPGWNQYGGPELLTTENHGGEGCSILYCDGHVEFVLAEDINDLKWTAGP